MSDASKVEKAAGEKPVARIVSSTPREKRVTLTYPVEFDGTLYEEIVIRRITGGELVAYIDTLKSGVRKMPPVVQCPIEVYEAMDADDQYAIDEAAMDFLPRVLRAAGE